MGTFDKALGNFTADVAYVGAVRHLYNLGLSQAEIKKQCLYPVSFEQIQKVIEDYEKEKAMGEEAVEYVLETDSLGRRSYRMVKKK